jgi:hypothetical protein
MPNIKAVAAIEQELKGIFSQLSKLQSKIHEKLLAFADGKTLKGNEHVGYLGEIYVEKR